MINSLLEIAVHCQIYVISRYSVHTLQFLLNTAPVIYAYYPVAFGTLELQFHGRFYADQTYRIIDIVIRIGLLEFFQPLCLHFSGIADNGCEINAVIVYADRRLLDIYPLQIRRIFHNFGYCLIINIGGNGSGQIFLKGSKGHRITNIHNVKGSLIIQCQRIPVFVFQGIQPVIILFFLEKFPCSYFRGIFAQVIVPFFLQVINVAQPVNIPQKAQTAGLTVRGIKQLAVFIHAHLEFPFHIYAVLIQDLHQAKQHGIHILVCRICAGVLNRYGISQLIISQNLSVPVIDVPSGSGSIDGFFGQLDIIILHFFAADDLQVKQMDRQYSKHTGKHNSQKKESGAGYLVNKFLQYFSQVFKQWSYLSFFPSLPDGGW